MALKSALPGMDILQGGKGNLEKSFASLNELVVISTKMSMDFVDFFVICDLTVPFNNVMYSLTYSGILSPISLSHTRTHTCHCLLWSACVFISLPC